MKRKKLKLKSLFIGLCWVFMLSACGDRPSWVLSENKMESLLFDVNLAETEVNLNYTVYRNDTYNNKRQELLDAVLRKHKVTQQQFDTSLVWYNAHLDKFFKIYERIGKSYTKLSDTLQTQITEDTQRLTELNRVNIWQGHEIYTLQSTGQPDNTFSFRIDSVDWERGDHFELAFDVLGINKSIRPEVVFYVSSNDTTVSNKCVIEINGSFSRIVYPRSLAAGTVSGFIHIPKNPAKGMLVLSNFKIYHKKPLEFTRQKLKEIQSKENRKLFKQSS